MEKNNKEEEQLDKLEKLKIQDVYKVEEKPKIMVEYSDLLIVVPIGLKFIITQMVPVLNWQSLLLTPLLFTVLWLLQQMQDSNP